MENIYFGFCVSLIEIQIPSSVKSIGDYCFNNCKSLTEIEFPSSIEKFGKFVLFNCTSITQISIPRSMVKGFHNRVASKLGLDYVKIIKT